MPVSFDSSALASAAHRLLVGVLEEDALPALDLEQVAEVARVEEELLPLVHRGSSPRAGGGTAARPPGEALDDVEELERAERLPREARRRRAAACDRGVAVARGREQDDRDARRLLVAP